MCTEPACSWKVKRNLSFRKRERGLSHTLWQFLAQKNTQSTEKYLSVKIPSWIKASPQLNSLFVQQMRRKAGHSPFQGGTYRSCPRPAASRTVLHGMSPWCHVWDEHIVFPKYLLLFKSGEQFASFLSAAHPLWPDEALGTRSKPNKLPESNPTLAWSSHCPWGTSSTAEVQHSQSGGWKGIYRPGNEGKNPPWCSPIHNTIEGDTYVWGRYYGNNSTGKDILKRLLRQLVPFREAPTSTIKLIWVFASHQILL